MADFQSPGTKITIKKKGAVSKIGVSTAIGGFQGICRKGPLNTPTLISGLADFEEVFGTRVTASPHVYDDVLAFYKNGGKSCYINRTADTGTAAAATRALNTLGPAGYGSVTSSVSGPWVLTNGDTIAVKVDGAGALTATFNATAASFTLTGGTYAGGGVGDVMTLTIDGVPGTQTIDLTAVGAAQADYVNAINSALIGAKAAASGGDIIITTDTIGSDAGGEILTLGGALNVRLHTGALGAFTNPGPNNVADIRAVTPAEAAAVIEAAVAGTTTTAGADSITIRVDVAGAGHSVQVDAGSTADAKIGLDNVVHSGTASTSVLTATISASSPGAWGNVTSTKVTRVDTAVTTVAATAAGSTTTLTLTSASKLQVGDQINITQGVDVQRGVIQTINGNVITLVAAITVPGGGYAGTEVVTLETWDLYVYDSSGTLVAPSPFRNLRSSTLAGPRYFGVVVNDTSRTPVTLADSAPAVADPRPANDTTAVLMTGGSDGATPDANDYIGSSPAKTGVYAWEKAKDVNFVSVSGIADILGASNGGLVLKGLETYLELRGDVQGIIAGPSGTNHTDIKTWVTSTCNFYSRFLTIMWPHIYMIDAELGVKRLKSPTGAFQGIIARTHAQTNFATAPAGTENGIVAECLGLEYEIDENSTEYDSIFPYGINAIINMPGEGFVVFGDTTLDSTKEFDVHGTVTGFCVAKREAKARTRFVNFRPNNESTRSQVVQTLTSLFRDWQSKGILQGTSDDEGFFIECDESNNTALVIAQKKLICRIGLAFIQPSRFVDITLEQDTRAVEAALAS